MEGTAGTNIKHSDGKGENQRHDYLKFKWGPQISASANFPGQSGKEKSHQSFHYHENKTYNYYTFNGSFPNTENDPNLTNGQFPPVWSSSNVSRRI